MFYIKEGQTEFAYMPMFYFKKNDRVDIERTLKVGEIRLITKLNMQDETFPKGINFQSCEFGERRG